MRAEGPSCWGTGNPAAQRRRKAGLRPLSPQMAGIGGILFSHEKAGSTACYNVDEPQKHHAQ